MFFSLATFYYPYIKTECLSISLPPWEEAQHLLETCLTFDSLGGGQQQMVLRQNVSYDVYGTFCMESEEKTQKTYPNMSCNSDQMFYSE